LDCNTLDHRVLIAPHIELSRYEGDTHDLINDERISNLSLNSQLDIEIKDELDKRSFIDYVINKTCPFSLIS